MNYSYYSGIDMSKEWFDAAIIAVQNPRVTKHQRFENHEKGFKNFFKWLGQNDVKDLSKLFVCMEHTGVYTIPLCEFLASQQITYTLVPGAEISNSSGIQRGKNDKLDAKRIARYAFKNRDDIRIHTLPKEELRVLKALLAYRERLVKARHAFKVSSKEMKSFDTSNVIDTICPRSNQMIDYLTEEMKQVEKDIDSFLNEHPQIKKNYELLLSVPGIGRQNALYMIFYTKNFVSFDCPKKFASYAGIAPFRNESGKSKKSNSKVSHKANKKMKTLLTSAVVCSLSKCPEYLIYYNKQIEKGKNENSIKNVLRNKIVSRAFAVVRRNSPYVNTHAFAA